MLVSEVSADGWAYVRAGSGPSVGAIGWMHNNVIDYTWPDPDATMYLIQPGDQLLAVAITAYGVADGAARGYANVLVYANKPGIFTADGNPRAHDYNPATDTTAWQGAKLAADAAMWLPGKAHADQLLGSGAVSSGSITGGLVADTGHVLDWADEHTVEAFQFAQQTVTIIADAATHATRFAVRMGAACAGYIATDAVDDTRAVLRGLRDVSNNATATLGTMARLVGAVPAALLTFLREQVERLVGTILEPVLSRVPGAMDVLGYIAAHPLDFLRKLGGALQDAFGQLGSHLLTDLQQGFVGWLAQETTLAIPQGSYALTDPSGLVALAFAAVRISPASIEALVEARLTQKLGADRAGLAMRALENGEQGATTLLHTIRTKGLGGAWGELRAALATSLQTDVSKTLDSIVSSAEQEVLQWVTQNVAQAAVTQVALLCEPAGDAIELLRTIYNVVQWLVDQMARIGNVLATLGHALHTVITNQVAAGTEIYGALTSAVPLLLDFIARECGLSNVGSTVTQVLAKVTGPIKELEQHIVAFLTAEAERIAALLPQHHGTAPMTHHSGAAGPRSPRQSPHGDGVMHGDAHALEGKLHQVVGAGVNALDRYKDTVVDAETVHTLLARVQQAYHDLDTYDLALDAVAVKGRWAVRAIIYVPDVPSPPSQAHRSTSHLDAPLDNALTDASTETPDTMTEDRAVGSHPPRGRRPTRTELMQIGDSEALANLPDTKVDHAALGSRAGRVWALPLSKAGSGGSRPSEDPAGWDDVLRFADIDEERHTESGVISPTNWVKFHLLSEHLHGPGKWWNLVPASKKDNTWMSDHPEEAAIQHLGSGKEPLYYDVQISYLEPSGYTGQNGVDWVNFPKSVEVDIGFAIQNTAGTWVKGQKLSGSPYTRNFSTPPIRAIRAVVVNLNSAGRDIIKTKLGLPERLARNIIFEHEEHGDFPDASSFQQRMERWYQDHPNSGRDFNRDYWPTIQTLILEEKITF